MDNGQQKQAISHSMFDIIGFLKNAGGKFAKKVKADALLNEATKEEMELQTAINEAMYEMELAHNQFDNAENSDHVQVSIYQLNAAQSKYQYLLKIVKERKSENKLKSSNF